MNTQTRTDRRVAVVTGAAGGLGRAIVRRLLADGLEVSAWDVSDAALAELSAEASSTRLTTAQVDVGDEDSIDRATESALARHGRLDILVNNAGIPGPTARLVDYPLDEWSSVLRVNLTGTFLCMRRVVPELLRSPAGRVVNVASVAAKLASPEICAYAASKAGVISLTRGLARELAATDVRVNCVTPGAIRTDIFRRWPDLYVQGLMQKIPIGRFGLPEELAAMVAWLSGTECSFSTGAVFDLSGGRADA